MANSIPSWVVREIILEMSPQTCLESWAMDQTKHGIIAFFKIGCTLIAVSLYEPRHGRCRFSPLANRQAVFESTSVALSLRILLSSFSLRVHPRLRLLALLAKSDTPVLSVTHIIPGSEHIESHEIGPVDFRIRAYEETDIAYHGTPS